MYPFERFSNEAKGVLTLAQEEAQRSRHAYIGTEHLVIGLIRQDGLASKTLVALGQNTEGLRQAIQATLSKEERDVTQSLIPTSRVKRVIEMAFEEARRLGSTHVGTDHMLQALLMEGEGVGAHVLVDRGVTVEKVRAEFEQLGASGVTERAGEPGALRQRQHWHLELPDPQGRVIDLDVTFPAEYSHEECQAVIDRIRALFSKG